LSPAHAYLEPNKCLLVINELCCGLPAGFIDFVERKTGLDLDGDGRIGHALVARAESTENVRAGKTPLTYF
jgi:hypothetical protein